jgi:hypothetical protein
MKNSPLYFYFLYSQYNKGNARMQYDRKMQMQNAIIFISKSICLNEKADEKRKKIIKR